MKDILRKISKEQDHDGNWYWIPNELLTEFNTTVVHLCNIDYENNFEDFDNFEDEYSKYATGGDKNVMPSFFSEKIENRTHIEYSVKVFQRKEDKAYTGLNGMVIVESDNLTHTLVAQNKGQSLGGFQVDLSLSDNDEKELRKQLDIVCVAMRKVDKIVNPQRYE